MSAINRRIFAFGTLIYQSILHPFIHGSLSGLPLLAFTSHILWQCRALEELYDGYDGKLILGVNADTNQTQFIKEIPAEAQNGFSYAFGTYNTFTLNKKKSFFGEINFNYNAPVYSLFNEITAYHRLDVGFRYTLRDKGWNFIIYGSDLTRGSLTYTNSEINNTPQKRSIYFDERSVRIGITYKFGNRKLRANTRESSNEEEKNRIR